MFAFFRLGKESIQSFTIDFFVTALSQFEDVPHLLRIFIRMDFLYSSLFSFSFIR